MKVHLPARILTGMDPINREFNADQSSGRNPHRLQTALCGLLILNQFSVHRCPYASMNIGINLLPVSITSKAPSHLRNLLSSRMYTISAQMSRILVYYYIMSNIFRVFFERHVVQKTHKG